MTPNTNQPDLLDALRREIDAASAAELPGIIGGLETLKATAWGRLYAVQTHVITDSESEKGEEFVTVKEAAVRLGMSEKWVRQHKEQLGGVRMGSALRFPWSRIEAYVRRHRMTR